MLFLCLWLAGGSAGLPAQGKQSTDPRLTKLRGEEGDFSLVPAANLVDAQSRAARVRTILRVAMGLWPMPTRTDLNAVVQGKLEMDDYSLEKVRLESVPGFFVTGNLYRPRGVAGRRPAVLSPHGHFPGGRFIDEGLDEVRRKIKQGAEQFEDGGRSFMQARCVQLARMGCVVFHYDMIGYGDSQQIPLEVIHRFPRSRVQFDGAPESGLYSPGALLRLQNALGLHTWNSIRALDFLASLEDVDPDRIAVTGGSGGGTQTFMLCAVDDRPFVSVPAVIVSTTRQGGCTCENVCGLRIGTFNLEFTALHAPKPLLLISANDATRTMPDKGFPQLQRHYEVCGAAGNVAHAALLQFPHNFNAVSRQAMYHWVNRHLRLGHAEPIVERPYRRLTRDELTVWDPAHPAPAFDAGFEQRLLDWLADDAQTQLSAIDPVDRASLGRYREMIAVAWDVLLRDLPANANIRFNTTASADRGRYREVQGLLRYHTIEGFTAEVPVIQLVPTEVAGPTVIWADGRGKSALVATDESLAPAIQRLVDAGRPVIGMDLLGQGDSTADGEPLSRQRSLPGEEAFGDWTYCYNLPLFARRVHDLRAAIRFARHSRPGAEVDVAGMRGAGPLVAAAVAQSHGEVDRAAIDTAGFRFAQETDIYGVNFLPGAVKYGDLPALLALAAPTRMWLAGEATLPPLMQKAYAASESAEQLTHSQAGPAEVVPNAAGWLTGTTP
jgi:dienelactone hydrolase